MRTVTGYSVPGEGSSTLISVLTVAAIFVLWWDTKTMFFFITHSVEEALFLATELIVMTPSPGRIAHRYRVDFGRRFVASLDARAVKADPEFIRLREEILQLIHSAPSAAEALLP